MVLGFDLRRNNWQKGKEKWRNSKDVQNNPEKEDYHDWVGEGAFNHDYVAKEGSSDRVRREEKYRYRKNA